MTKHTLSSEGLVTALREVHARVRTAVLEECRNASYAKLAGEPRSVAGDVGYAIDEVAEREMLRAIEELIATRAPVVVIGEGIPKGLTVLPADAKERDCQWRIIVDPIDGTRGFMFQKRPAWILTGAAPNNDATATLGDITVAVQTELPLMKQYLCDSFWAIKGQGAHGDRRDMITDEIHSLIFEPSQVTSLAHGFGTVCSFFAGGRDLLGRIADELSRRLLAGNQAGEARIFEDQYISTGGQLAGLLMGQDRFVADLRPLLLNTLSSRGEPLGHCCHPYDLCTKLIVEEGGVLVTSVDGEPVNAPLDTETNVAWVGYANPRLRASIEPVLYEIITTVMR